MIRQDGICRLVLVCAHKQSRKAYEAGIMLREACGEQREREMQGISSLLMRRKCLQEVIMAGFWIAVLSGALMSVQGVFNTQVTKQSGIWVANAFVQLTALLVCLAVWLAADRSSFTALFQVEPKYMLLGGVIGTFITYTVIKSMEMLGPARSAMFIVVSQLILAYLIELFGLFGVEKQPVETKKLLGMGIMIAGIVIFKWT